MCGSKILSLTPENPWLAKMQVLQFKTLFLKASIPQTSIRIKIYQVSILKYSLT